VGGPGEVEQSLTQIGIDSAERRREIREHREHRVDVEKEKAQEEEKRIRVKGR
jgi:hypothetical protein